MNVWLKSCLYNNKAISTSLLRGCLCFVLLFFLGGLRKGFAQNLVPNGSFETYTTCPTATGQLSYAVPWYCIPPNNIELYNACSKIYGVPSRANGLDYQPARTGVGYAGFWMYNSISNSYREYVQIGLTGTLINGKCYYVEFYANLQNGLKYAVNNMSAHFSTDTIKTTGTGYVLNLTPQVMVNGNPVINDTLNWVRVAGIYTATGGEKFITIGNFMDDAHTDTLNTHGGMYNGAYYFIDDVSVTEITQPTWPLNDTALAHVGDSVYIGTTMSGLNCIWSHNGSTISTAPGLKVSPSVTTTYAVQQSFSCGTFKDTITVFVGQPLASITATHNLCFGASNGVAQVSITNGAAPFVYHWSNNTTNATETGLPAGSYTVTVTDHTARSATASVTITQPTAIGFTITNQAPATSGFCDGSATIQGYGGCGAYVYTWSNGAGTNATATGLCGTSTYTVTVADCHGCFVTGTVNVGTVGALAVNISTMPTTCGNTNGVATAHVSSGYTPFNYLWSNMATTPQLTGLADGTYAITVTDSHNYTASATATVTAIGSPTIVLLAQQVSCFGGADGSLQTNLTGGTGPFTYVWSNAATTGGISGLGTGSYSVTVNDATPCSATASATISTPTVLKATTTATKSSGSNGTATVNATGGTPSYAYNWSNAKTTASISGLAAGTYYVTVQDKNGCVIKDTAIVKSNVDIAELNSSPQQVTIWPNPVTGGVLHVDNVKSTDNIELYTLLGQKILQTKAANSIDVSRLENGIYFIRITSSITKENIVKKLVIQ